MFKCESEEWSVTCQQPALQGMRGAAGVSRNALILGIVPALSLHSPNELHRAPASRSGRVRRALDFVAHPPTFHANKRNVRSHSHHVNDSYSSQSQHIQHIHSQLTHYTNIPLEAPAPLVYHSPTKRTYPTPTTWRPCRYSTSACATILRLSTRLTSLKSLLSVSSHCKRTWSGS